MSEETNYTRFRSNVQLGDGPDMRGDVTAEVSRPADLVSADETREEFEAQLSAAVKALVKELQAGHEELNE